MHFEIRKPKENELRRIVEITNEAFNWPFNSDTREEKYNEAPEPFIEKMHNGEVLALVAVSGGDMVGAVRYKFPDEATIELFRLAVPRQYRGQGIAPALIDAVEKIGREQGCQMITLDCMVEKGLVPYYEKFGFAVTEIKPHLNHHDAYMAKPLTT